MSIGGCECCLLQCRDEFRWFNTFQIISCRPFSSKGMCDCSRCEQVLVFPWDQRELLRFRHSQPFGGERFLMLRMKFVFLKFLLWGCLTELCLYTITIFSKMVLTGLVYSSFQLWFERRSPRVWPPLVRLSRPRLQSSLLHEKTGSNRFRSGPGADFWPQGRKCLQLPSDSRSEKCRSWVVQVQGRFPGCSDQKFQGKLNCDR